jgi:hypothetical protein
MKKLILLLVILSSTITCYSQDDAYFKSKESKVYKNTSIGIKEYQQDTGLLCNNWKNGRWIPCRNIIGYYDNHDKYDHFIVDSNKKGHWEPEENVTVATYNYNYIGSIGNTTVGYSQYSEPVTMSKTSYKKYIRSSIIKATIMIGVTTLFCFSL